MPLSPGALAAARYIVSGPPKKLFSFALAEESLRRLGQATEAFLMTQQERGFRTLDYYKQLERSLPEAAADKEEKLCRCALYRLPRKTERGGEPPTLPGTAFLY